MQRPASRSRFDVARDTWLSFLATMVASGGVSLRRPLSGAVVLVLMGLRTGAAAEPDNVLLDFTATWCGPCQQMSSTISKLERQGFPIRKVDIDKEPALASRFNVQSIPCFVLVSNGKDIDRVTGLTTEQQLRSMLNKLPKPTPAVARRNEDTRKGNGSSIAGLGLPLPLGQMDQTDGKRPPVGLPFLGSKNKGKNTRVAEVPFGEQPVTRGQNGEERVAVDPLQASVRLRVQDGTGINFGSGTIIDSKSGRTVILTCGHIFRKAANDSKVEVDVFHGVPQFTDRVDPPRPFKPLTLAGRVLHYDLAADIGIVAIDCDSVLPVVRLGSSRGEPALEDRVSSIGCGGGDKPTREDLTLTALNRYAGPDNIECTGMPQQGRSGGGLFLGSEQIGVCIAADPKEQRGIYAGMKPIAQLLEKVGLGHLAPTPMAAEGALADTKGTAEIKTADRGTNASADDIGRLLGELGASALSGPPAASGEDEGAEIVCIVRSKTPGVASRVVIVNQASHRFIADLLHESQASAERATARRDAVSSQANRRPIETSFEPQPYRRQRAE